MLRKLINLVIVFPIALVAVLFGVANRHSMMISLDPFSREAPALVVNLPVFVVLFAVLAAGVVLGGVAVWFAQGYWRQRCRMTEAEAQKLKSEADGWRRKAMTLQASPAPTGKQLAAPQPIGLAALTSR